MGEVVDTSGGIDSTPVREGRDSEDLGEGGDRRGRGEPSSESMDMGLPLDAPGSRACGEGGEGGVDSWGECEGWGGCASRGGWAWDRRPASVCCAAS